MNNIDFTNWRAVNAYVKEEAIDKLYDQLIQFFTVNNHKSIVYHMKVVADKSSIRKPHLVKCKMVSKMLGLIECIKKHDFKELDIWNN